MAGKNIINNLINNLSIGVVLTDKEGKIIFSNERIKKMTGYNEAEIKTIDDWYEKAYPDQNYRKKVKELFQYDIENDIHDRTYKITTAEGERRYFNFRYSKLESDKILFEIIDISNRIEQKQELEKQKMIFENLFTNSLEAIVLLNGDLNIIEANRKFEEIFEVSRSDIINENINKVAISKISQNGLQREEEMFLQNHEWEREVPYLVNNEIKYCNVHVFSVDNENHGNLIYVAMDDITEKKEREIELKEVKERLELAVEGGNIGVWDWDFEAEFIHYNKNWAQMLDYKVSELGNNLDTWLYLVHPDDKDEALKDLMNHLEGKTEKYFNEHRLKTKSGKWKWIRDIGKVTERDAEGDAQRIVGVHIDIDQEKRAAKEIEYLSNHDELTGLYNRRYFNEELKRLYNSRKYPISIIVGDMNKLKDINDNYGHSMGDRYIKTAAEAIKNTVRNEDVVARIGGDEFAIILPETDYSKADEVVERILKRIEEGNKIEELPIPLTISLGYETTEHNKQNHSLKNIRKCYNEADKKMYEQKFADR